VEPIEKKINTLNILAGNEDIDDRSAFIVDDNSNSESSFVGSKDDLLAEPFPDASLD
jgi:hypothetical protein